MPARYACPLAPCCPRPEDGLRNPTIQRNVTVARMSATFPTIDAYLRHIERGHFIARENAPMPLTTEQEE